MSSLKSHTSLEERFDQLSADLLAEPMRIALMSKAPYAILRYEPEDEWKLRKLARLLASKLEAHGWRVHSTSMADLMWQAVDETEGMDALVRLERARGFDTAQRQVNLFLSDPDFRPLPALLVQKMVGLNPKRDVIFLMRLAALTPSIYHMSKLSEELMLTGRAEIPLIIFYPGGIEGNTGLRFMDISGREALGNYRVKIYG
jgi:hypothetical protein